jgi:predicted DNA-binding protein (MmcQ/YjbR family)
MKVGLTAMNVDEIRKFCLSFPGATEKLQWEDALCFKVSEKLFAVLGLDNVRLMFKCAPEIFTELIEREDIDPSPYLGRYKWVILHRLDAVPWAELKDLIRQSHEMVAAKTSRKSPALRAASRKPKKRRMTKFARNR